MFNLYYDGIATSEWYKREVASQLLDLDGRSAHFLFFAP